MKLKSSELLFSVVVPLYNKSGYVVSSINSVLSQSVSCFEIIVVDDGSTDDSNLLVRSIDDARIRLYKKKNGGVSSARNFGALKSRGDYLVFLDADDILEVNFLSELYLEICQNNKPAVISTGYYLFSGDVVVRKVFRRRAIKYHAEYVNNFFNEWRVESFCFTSSIAINKEAINNLPYLFMEGESLGEDQDLWFRLAENYSFFHINKPLVGYNVGVIDSLTAINDLEEILPCFKRLLDRALVRKCTASLYMVFLVSSHYINVSRSLWRSQKYLSALKIYTHPISMINFMYWLKTLFFLAGFKK